MPRSITTVLLLFLLLSPLPALAQSGPAAFLQEFSGNALKELTDKSASEAQKEQRFRSLLQQGFDVPTIAQFVIARYWRGASQEEQQEFIAVFEDYLVQRFLPLFAQYEGQGMTVGAPRSDSGSSQLFWVPLQIDQTGGQQPIQTEWRLRAAGGSYKILDVRAEGASMALTLRDEYASVMRQKGGLAGLTQALKEQIAKGVFKPK